jgi:predicted TIM-barrel fold metal-dependent hydrolase
MREPVVKQEPLIWDGAVDADGHVLEPADLWGHYLEAELRPRGPQLLRNADGWEYFQWENGGTNPGTPGMLGTMGDTAARPGPERGYAEFMPFGAADPAERVALLDREHLEAVVLYPTLALLWERDVPDPGLALPLMRAYNRWLADFCRDRDGRLVAIAHLTLTDVEGSVAELERAAADGCRGAFVGSFTHTRKSLGHPDHDPLWAAAQDLGMPIGIHPMFEPPHASPLSRFDDLDDGNGVSWYFNLNVRQRIEQAFLSFFAHHTFDRFPRLTVGVLESGAGWIGSTLDRADQIQPRYQGRAEPSEIFREQCFISGDPDETMLPLVIDHVGADCFVWASDYPHPDHPPAYIDAVDRLVSGLKDDTRAKVLGGNAKRLYRL